MLVSLHIQAPSWEELGAARLAEAAVTAGAFNLLSLLRRCCAEEGCPLYGSNGPYAGAVTAMQLLRCAVRAGAEAMGPLTELVRWVAGHGWHRYPACWAAGNTVADASCLGSRHSMPCHPSRQCLDTGICLQGVAVAGRGSANLPWSLPLQVEKEAAQGSSRLLEDEGVWQVLGDACALASEPGIAPGPEVARLLFGLHSLCER